jgi:hypothetical protein
MSIYLALTNAFNGGALRAILSSGQAVVLHRLARIGAGIEALESALAAERRCAMSS